MFLRSLSRLQMPRKTTRGNASKRPMKKEMISIIIPVHNEEKYLPFSLRPLLALKGIRIIFVLDRCRDKSEVIVRKFGEKHGNTIIITKNVEGKTENPTWEAYMTGAKHVKHGRMLFLGSDVIIDRKVFNYLEDAKLLKFRYVNYSSHFWYAFEKIIQRFSAKSYCVECIDVRLINSIPFLSESYDDIVRGKTKLADVLNASFLNKKFVCIDAVECLHLRPRVPVDRQFLQGYVRHMRGVPFLKVLSHSLLYRKVHVFRGYVFRMLRKSENNEINGLSMYIQKYPFWKALGYALRHFSLKSLFVYLRARFGDIKPSHILKWGRRQHLLVVPYENKILKKSFNNPKILDCGCGVGYWGYKAKIGKLSESIVGLDIHKKYLLIAKKLKVYEDLVLASAASLPFKEETFNLIIAPELIEHLTKQNGEEFLKQTPKIAKNILITTPVHHFKVYSQTPSERHLSHWSEMELQKHGFSTEKCGKIIIAFLSG